MMAMRQEIIAEIEQFNNTLSDIVDAYSIVWNYTSEKPKDIETQCQHNGVRGASNLIYENLIVLSSRVEKLFNALEAEEVKQQGKD